MGEKRQSVEGVDFDLALKRINNKALYKKYIEPNKNLVWTMTKAYTTNPSDIDDNYQENCVNLYKGISTYDESRSLSNWIMICVKRYTIELEKRRSRKSLDLIDIQNTPSHFFVDQDVEKQTPLTMDNWREVFSDEIIDALDDLNEDYRDMFLKKVMGFKLKEIMAEFHANGSLKVANLETTKSRIFLTRRKLELALKEYNEKRRD